MENCPWGPFSRGGGFSGGERCGISRGPAPGVSDPGVPTDAAQGADPWLTSQSPGACKVADHLKKPRCASCRVLCLPHSGHQIMAPTRLPQTAQPLLPSVRKGVCPGLQGEGGQRLPRGSVPRAAQPLPDWPHERPAGEGLPPPPTGSSSREWLSAPGAAPHLGVPPTCAGQGQTLGMVQHPPRPGLPPPWEAPSWACSQRQLPTAPPNMP